MLDFYSEIGWLENRNIHDVELQSTNELIFKSYGNGMNGFLSILMISAIKTKLLSVSALKVMQLKRNMLRIILIRVPAVCVCVAKLRVT